MDYWFCVSVCLHVYVFSCERYNVQMLRASLSETPGIGPIMQFVLYNNLSLFLVTLILNIFELSQYVIIISKWLQYGLGLLDL